MTLKATKGHRKWRNSMGMCHFILVVCSNSVFTLHYFRDINITTFTVYVTVYDSEKSFNILKSHSVSIRQLKLKARVLSDSRVNRT